MATSRAPLPYCSICGQNVPLEMSKTDEQGHIVHEECYAVSISRFQGPSSRGQEVKILNGWKEIASFLGKGVRTVQRYERQLRLPIRRIRSGSTGSVVATKGDLADWVSRRPVGLHAIQQPRAEYHRSNMLKADFLRIESELGLTFSGMALAARDREKRRRTTRAARLAYDTIMRLKKNVDLGDVVHKLERNVEQLKSELQGLGQSF